MDEMRTSLSGGSTPARARCVVYAACARSGVSTLPEQLRRVLEQKGMELIAQPTPHGALAALLVEERARAEGAGGSTPLVALVIEPESLTGADEFAHTVRTHVTGAALWRYDAGAMPQLRGWGSAHDQAHAGNPRPTPPNHELRLAGVEHEQATTGASEHEWKAQPPDPGADEHELDSAIESGRLVTQEELGMLLRSGGPQV